MRVFILNVDGKEREQWYISEYSELHTVRIDRVFASGKTEDHLYHEVCENTRLITEARLVFSTQYAPLNFTVHKLDLGRNYA